MAVFPMASMINCYKINCVIGKHCTIGRLTTGFILVLHHVTRRKGAKRSRNEQNNLVTRRSHTCVMLRWWSVDRSRRNPLFGKSVDDNFVKFAPSFSKPPCSLFSCSSIFFPCRHLHACPFLQNQSMVCFQATLCITSLTLCLRFTLVPCDSWKWFCTSLGYW